MTVVHHGHTHLLRRLLRNPAVRPIAILDLAELDINEEISQLDVNKALAELSAHLTEKERGDEFRELKYVLERDAIAWADGEGQPSDMSLAAWKAELERRIKEQVKRLSGGAS